MLRYRLHGEGRLRLAETGVIGEPVPSLLVWGGVDAGSAPYLEPAFVAEAPPALPRAPGPWRIAGQASDGTVLYDLSFAMPVAGDGDGSSGFAFACPCNRGGRNRSPRSRFPASAGRSHWMRTPARP